MTDQTTENTKVARSQSILNKLQVASTAMLLIALYLPFAKMPFDTDIVPIDGMNFVSPLLLILAGVSFALGITQYLGRALLGLMFVLWIISAFNLREEIEVIQQWVGFENLVEYLSVGAFLLIPGMVLGVIAVFLRSKSNDELTRKIISKASNIDTADLKERATTIFKDVSSEGSKLFVSIKSGDATKADIKAFAMKKPVMIGAGSVVLLLLLVILSGGSGPISKDEARKLLVEEFVGYPVKEIKVGNCEQDTDYDRYYDCQWTAYNSLWGQEMTNNWAGFNYIDGEWVLQYTQ